MAKYKEPEKYVYKAKTIQYIQCLQQMTNWGKIVAEQFPNKRYKELLNILVENEFFRNAQNFTVKMLAEKAALTNVKINLWVREIYEDIIQLNNDMPELFTNFDGIPVDLYFFYRGNGIYISSKLPIVPRLYETFEFYFLEAALGMGYFWVKDVSHTISENTTRIAVTMEGGMVNRYRELLIEKAKFNEHFDIFESQRMNEYQINNLLRKMDKDK